METTLTARIRSVLVLPPQFSRYASVQAWHKAQFSGPALGVSTPVNPPVTPTTDPAILYPAGRDIILAQAISSRFISMERRLYARRKGSAWTAPSSSH